MTVMRRKWGTSDFQTLGLGLAFLTVSLSFAEAQSSGWIGWLAKGVMVIAFPGFLICAWMASFRVPGRNERTGDAVMSAENLTIQEVSEARIEAILAELKKAGNSEGGPLTGLSEFELADVFADRFRSALLGGAGPETGQDRVWLERRKTVENVIEVASWDPRLSCRKGYVEGAS